MNIGKIRVQIIVALGILELVLWLYSMVIKNL